MWRRVALGVCACASAAAADQSLPVHSHEGWVERCAARIERARRDVAGLAATPRDPDLLLALDECLTMEAR